MLGVWGELASHKRLFNPPPRFSRLGTQCPALMSCHVYLCMCVLYGYFGVCEYGGGFYLYLFTYGWYAYEL